MAKPLFTEDFTVVNVGVPSFADSIRQAGGNALSVDWAPPAQGDREVGMRLAHLLGDPRIDAANAQALERFLAAEPVLRRVGIAKADIPNMGERMILHSGPPVTWDVMAGPMRGAVIGAIMLEGWADDLDKAAKLAASGEITFE